MLRSIVCEGRVLTADNSPSNLKIAASEVPVLLVLGGKDVLVPRSVARYSSVCVTPLYVLTLTNTYTTVCVGPLHVVALSQGILLCKLLLCMCPHATVVHVSAY